MHWEILIIPLIALGVWILGTLVKGEEDDRTRRGTRRPGGPSGQFPRRRPVTDLDRFLEEARRRREMEERRKAPSAPPPRPTVSRPPLSERPPRPREAFRPAPPVVRAEEVPVAFPVARPAPQPAAVREVPAKEAVLVVPRPHPAAEAPPPPPPPAPTTTRETRPSPILQQVRSLLSKPQTAGTAFVLREIFDRPRCMRRR